MDARRDIEGVDVGVNLAGNQFGHVPPMDAIERVEVIRAPASTFYGADAKGGVINWRFRHF